MITETLTSLAMLKVKIDQGGDYLDYLRPFILHVLTECKPDPVTDLVIHDYLRTQFGLEIPSRTIQVVLKRISRNHHLKMVAGVYHITGELPTSGIIARKSEAERHIQAVVSGLEEFSKNTAKSITTTDEAVTAICSFLTQFQIPCLRAYLRGTAIPNVEGMHNTDIVLVSQYVQLLQRSNPDRFNSFMVMAQGHMLANALLCPDLQNAPKTFKGVTFYLDTPLLIRRLDLEGEYKTAAIVNLIDLLHNLGATIAAFSHSREELEHVLTGAANYIDDLNGRGAVVLEARRRGTTKSDILLLAAQLDERLADANIELRDTPSYTADFQINEIIFESVLEDEVSYFNPRAKEYDINSVRSIYVLRGNTSPSILEKSKAVLVTTNSGFARAAYEYGQKHDQSIEVSSVITDFSLANMAWLKAPMGAPSLPTNEILAFSYAALQPTKDLLCKYLEEIDKLEKLGKITARDHQLLRSSTLAQEELMRLTLGDEDALTAETVTKTLERVCSEIKKEESEKFIAEQIAHKKTRDDLDLKQVEVEKVQKLIYWRCSRRANLCSWGLALFIILLLLSGIPVSFGLKPTNASLSNILLVVFGVATALSLIFGLSVNGIRGKIEKYFKMWFIKREAAMMGINLEETK